MKRTTFEKSTEYLLPILLIALAVFMFREVWISVQELEAIYRFLLEGAIFTEGPPVPGVERYLLFCLSSGAWFLFGFGLFLSRRAFALYLVQITFSLMPVWFIYYAYIEASAYYEFDSLRNFLVSQFLPSWNLMWFILSIVIAVIGSMQCRSMRRAAT
jgi:hypothetical protein